MRLLNFKNWLWLTPFVYFIFLSQPSWSAQLACTSLLSPYERLIDAKVGNDFSDITAKSLLRPSDSFLELHESNSDNYALNRSLVRTTPRDQCCIGSCWINATLTALELGSVKSFDKPVKLSDMFIFKKYLESQTIKVLKRNLHETDLKVWRQRNASHLL